MHELQMQCFQTAYSYTQSIKIRMIQKSSIIMYMNYECSTLKQYFVQLFKHMNSVLQNGTLWNQFKHTYMNQEYNTTKWYLMKLIQMHLYCAWIIDPEFQNCYFIRPVQMHGHESGFQCFKMGPNDTSSNMFMIYERNGSKW